MASIDNLFDWILEDIFLKLPRHDRLVCKEVCKRWYNILMERRIFQADRHIFLDTTDSTAAYAAMTVLIQAKKPYEIYSIKDFTTAPKIGLQQFFELVGTSIEEFEYRGSGRSCDFFTTMPLLKYLTLKTYLEDTGEIFSTIKRNDPNFAYHHLERLKLKSISEDELEYGLLSLKYIKKFIPQECSVVLSEVSVYTHNQFNHLCQILEEVTTINDITVRATELSQTQIEKLLEVKNNFNCDKFAMYCTSEHHPYGVLGALQNNIQDITLHCYSLPPNGIDLPKITDLQVELSGAFNSLKSLEHLINLKELCLTIDRDECGFGHESLIMPMLHNLELDTKKLCNECLYAMANSFENMEYFSLITTSKFSWDQIKMLIDNLKNLTNFHLDPNEVVNQEEDFSFETQEYLRWICIKQISNLKCETIRKMSESFRNLESLNLHTYNSLHVTPLLSIAQSIVPVFAKLVIFTFSFDMPDDSIEYLLNEFNIFCEYMASIGFPVEKNESAKQYVVKNHLIELFLDRKMETSKLVHETD